MTLRLSAKFVAAFCVRSGRYTASYALVTTADAERYIVDDRASLTI